MKLPNQKTRLKLILLFHFAALIIYHIFGFTGHYGYDDMHYARLAHDLLRGYIDLNDHFSYRTPIIILTAGSYFLFGLSDFASSLPSLLITACILITVYFILRNEGELILALGLSLTLFSNWLIFYSDKIMPDNYLALAVILSLFIVYRYRYINERSRPGLHSFWFTLSLLFGIMAKESIILIIPFLVFVLFSDLIQKINLKFWLYSVLYGILLLVFYFLIIRLLTGSFTRRFEAITGNSYLNLCSYDVQSSLILMRRVLYEFFNLTVVQGMFTAFIFILPAIFRYHVRRLFYMESPVFFFMSASIILLLSSNFMTTSVKNYIPLCLDPRHYLFLVPVAAIPAAHFIKGFIEYKSGGWLLIVISVLTAIWSWFLSANSFWAIYLPVAILTAIFFLLKPAKPVKMIFPVLLVVALMAEPAKMVIYARKIKYNKQKEAVFNHLLNLEGKYYVITNEVQSRIGQYYCGFDDSRFRFLAYDQFRFDTLTDRKVIFLKNWYTMYLSQRSFSDIPYYARNNSNITRSLYLDDKLQLDISEVKDLSVLIRSEQATFSTFIDFESAVPNWFLRENSITDSTSFRGNKCNKFDEYSATFYYPVDSLHFDPGERILVTSRFYCNYEDITSAKLVISVEEGNDTYIWEGLPVNKFIKAYSNWWQVKYEYEIPAEKIRKGSVLKVYLWNQDKRTSLIDDFEITVRRLTY